VHDLYFEPKYEEFRPRTIWSLSNAFTSAQEFYNNRAPLLDLKPFLEEEQIEHYHLETSNVFKIASGKAA
jgi:hypothetical protein